MCGYEGKEIQLGRVKHKNLIIFILYLRFHRSSSCKSRKSRVRLLVVVVENQFVEIERDLEDKL